MQTPMKKLETMHILAEAMANSKRPAHSSLPAPLTSMKTAWRESSA
ncbi:MAG: hypothetical protein INR71_01050 [Terriglobus roseus]|nr:hypothetical protein [Terriglobus roseus]